MIDEHTRYFATEYNPGISVRDKLAESAMIGLVSYSGTMNEHTIESIAEHAYKLADSMIEKSKTYL